MKVRQDGKLMSVHHNMTFNGPSTELVLVGVGLGDIAVMHQVGNSFLEMCHGGFDPELGKVVISFGSTVSAFYPIKGDYNIWWCWGNKEDWIKEYFEKVKYPPDLVMCPSRDCVREVMETENVYVMYAPTATGSVFHPLWLKREGLGYTGHPNKSHKQMKKVIYPLISREDFEWRKTDWFIYLEDLNHWYNTKLVTFGMVSEINTQYNILTNRVFEVFASGTPLIYSKHKGFQEVFGIDYRYQTESAEQTLSLVDQILSNPEEALDYMDDLSMMTLETHNYMNRLSQLFETIRELGL
jgi:hypothetical protein